MTALEETLRRLKRERDEADRRYNDALTALDRALPPPPEFPPLRGAYDDELLAALNAEWKTLTAPPSDRGWRGRLIGFIWRTVAPYFERQLTFNAHLVDHLNRNVAAARDAHRAAEDTTARLRDEFARLGEFHARALLYLQQVTAYIDTRDRDAAGGALVVNASLSGLAENVDKRWETLAVREQRADARAAALASGHDELRAMLGVSQQASLSLKREVERLLSRDGVKDGANAGQRIEGREDRDETPASRPAARDAFHPLDSYKYVGFEDQFRGSRDEIRARLSTYLPLFAGAADVVDVGCGRGEFLELLAGAGVAARGIDVESRDGRALSRARPRRRRSGRRRLSGVPAGRVARRPLRRAGGGTPAARIPPAVSRARVPQDPPGRPARCSKRSTRRAGSRSSTATSATSPTSGRCIRTR